MTWFPHKSLAHGRMSARRRKREGVGRERVHAREGRRRANVPATTGRGNMSKTPERMRSMYAYH